MVDSLRELQRHASSLCAGVEAFSPPGGDEPEPEQQQQQQQHARDSQRAALEGSTGNAKSGSDSGSNSPDDNARWGERCRFRAAGQPG
jgi:hypothetical protein